MTPIEDVTPTDVKAMPLAEFWHHFGFTPADIPEKWVFALTGERVSPQLRATFNFTQASSIPEFSNVAMHICDKSEWGPEHSPADLDECQRRLDEWATNKGRDNADGNEMPSRKAIKEARQIAKDMPLPTHFSPTGDGGIGFEWQGVLCIMVEYDGSIRVIDRSITPANHVV